MKDIVRVLDLSGLKDMFQVLDQLVILSRSAESEEADRELAELADLRDNRLYSRG